MGPKHPFADQFPNRLAWRFEKDLETLARTTETAERLQRDINTWPTVMARRRDPGVATAWHAFVNRKLRDLPWPARPEQVQAITTTRARQVIRALGFARPGRGATDATAPAPVAAFYRGDTGERVQVAEAPPYLRRAGPEVETARPVGRPVAGSPQVYATDRQRAPGGPVTAGWVTEHVGRWHGHETEVVYNPRRHQVMVTQQDVSDVSRQLEADGWQRHHTDTGRVVWTRDRLTATRAALARLDQAAALGIAPSGPDHQIGPIDGPALAR